MPIPVCAGHNHGRNPSGYDFRRIELLMGGFVAKLLHDGGNLMILVKQMNGDGSVVVFYDSDALNHRAGRNGRRFFSAAGEKDTTENKQHKYTFHFSTSQKVFTSSIGGQNGFMRGCIPVLFSIYTEIMQKNKKFSKKEAVFVDRTKTAYIITGRSC